MSRQFVDQIKQFANENDVDIVRFQKGERKNDIIKRQLDKRGIEFVALDNGVLSCDNPRKAQQIADHLDEKKIDRVVRKWFARLPHPFTPQDRKAGFRYELSILQAASVTPEPMG